MRWLEGSFLLALSFLGAASQTWRGKLFDKSRTCETGSCYPGTGNLLVGREDKLYASSTCGITKQEKYCIVSHLENSNAHQTPCAWCDSRASAEDKSMSHNISNIVDIFDPHDQNKDPWWQSENGVEKVYIQLDMEAEFHFTHLIINFKTFRPAAMLIERSQDFGKTWQVYRYFAFNCAKSFPGVSTEQYPPKLRDVICDNHYSHVNPSHGGELIFRVIQPNIHVEDPFATEVQELIKMTNLRINLTALHTFGDNLLDKRKEIQEKYYYAIHHMIVRGSCSCYGHANRCLPKPELANQYYPPKMVHGQCECTHNTKGPNCDKCEDFYNDLPWKAAFGKSQNACQKCNCNNHSTSCEFDENIFILSGNLTGGVCQNCQHNTRGKNCQECIPFYYHEPSYDIQDPSACQPCHCDTRGTIDDGVCDPRTDVALSMESGACHCKENVAGRRCDRCREGYWNYNESSETGCEPCRCNLHGTLGNLGCDVITGECTCKRFVIGQNCNQCTQQFWGLSEDRDGCKPCDCDPGGSYDNDCDVITGQCHCRPHLIGRTCDEPEPSYFTGFPDYLVYEAELANGSPDVKIQIVEPYRDGREVIWTGTGYMRTYEKSRLNFTINNIQSPLKYDIVIRYAPQLPNGWDNVNVRLVHMDPIDPNGPCAYEPMEFETNAQLPGNARAVTLGPSVCLEPGKTYHVILTFEKYDPDAEVVSASVLVDSIVLYPAIEALPILMPDNKYEISRYRCLEPFLQPNHGPVSKTCQKYIHVIGSYVNQGAYRCDCDPTGSKSFECSKLGGECECKPNVVGRRCDMCAPGTYGFGPEGCIACDCNSLALDNICDPLTGQCKCRANTYGRVCDQCQIGFWNFPNCQRCECNGHAQTCDSKTGVCFSCLNFTEGQHCERCLEGYYGAPQLGYDIPCRACQCPGSIDSGHSYADRCDLDPYTQDVICSCKTGYAGAHCDVCADNYFGNPEEPGGSCQACDCNNNIDIARPGNCDSKTGKCLQCLYNTKGDHCEICKERFYGDAINQQCTECVCELLGIDETKEYCNRTTGQCPCLPNVVGLSCSDCAENHWKIASGTGCEPCNCDPVGSYSKNCNAYLGQCDCREGFGSTRCNECMHNHWGDPIERCHRCDCEKSGSLTLQCDRTNGSCVCIEGIGGYRCDKCARGYLGEAPQCSFCGECFKNWDDILNKLNDETNDLYNFAANIKEVGVWGAYTTEFGEMEEDIKKVEMLLKNTYVSTEEIQILEGKISDLKEAAKVVEAHANATTRKLEDTEANVKRADLALMELRTQMNDLLNHAKELKENALRLQEANVEGALNLTRKARKDSNDAEEAAENAAKDHLVNAEHQCKRALAYHNRTSEGIGKEIRENKGTLNQLNDKLKQLEESIPGLNEKVCGKFSECDSACGGAGCGSCGGLSCDLGAITLANISLDLVNKADKAVKEKEAKAEELLRSVSQARADAINAKNKTQSAFDKSEAAKNSSEQAMKKSVEFSTKLDRFMATAGAKPSEIRSLADETRKLNINLEPEKVRDLALKIQSAVSNLTNIDDILAETNDEKERALAIKEEANKAKMEAEEILNVVSVVSVALDEASNAQTKADAAIRLASSDIAAAEKHLIQISSESSDAQAKANETIDNVRALKDRLSTLKTEFTKNKLSAEEIQKEVDSISADSNRTLEAVSELSKKYHEAETELAKRAGRSESAKIRATELSASVSRFLFATHTKEKDLIDLETSYREKDDALGKLNEEMEELSKRMEEYVQFISVRSKHFSECIA